MRNLLRFLTQNSFVLLFLVFELVAVLLIYNHNPIQRGYLARAIDLSGSFVYQTTHQISKYMHLSETNQQLAKENARLRSQPVITQTDSSIINPGFTYLPANVINNSVNKVNNYLTLDVGSKDGIQPDMGVIGPAGVVGVVKSVSPRFSRVLSLLNNQLQISIKLQKGEFFGSMSWNNTNYRTISISEIPLHAIAEPGDTILTSGYSSIFPEGIPVAIVESKEPTKDGNFLLIEARLINDFKRISKVYIIKDLFRDEIKDLEDRTQ